MAQRIHFLHHSPGRLRIGVLGLKGNAKLAQAIHSLAQHIPDVKQITASTVTGSVLICYDRSDPGVLDRLQAMVSNAEALLDQWWAGSTLPVKAAGASRMTP